MATKYTTQKIQALASVSVQVLPENKGRTYLLIQNAGAKLIYVRFGSAATANDLGIAGGGSYEPINPPYQTVHLNSNGSTTAIIIEGEDKA